MFRFGLTVSPLMKEHTTQPSGFRAAHCRRAPCVRLESFWTLRRNWFDSKVITEKHIAAKAKYMKCGVTCQESLLHFSKQISMLAPSLGKYWLLASLKIGTVRSGLYYESFTGWQAGSPLNKKICPHTSLLLISACGLKFVMSSIPSNWSTANPGQAIFPPFLLSVTLRKPGQELAVPRMSTDHLDVTRSLLNIPNRHDNPHW